MPILIRDYETRSTLDLPDVGAWRYSQHASTDIFCCGYAIDDGPIELWLPGDPIPAAFSEAANNPDWLVAAFNDARCQPPLSLEEVRTIVNSICAREMKRRGVS